MKQVVAENVAALMKDRRLKQQHVAALAKQRGAPIDQTTVGRIARAEIPTTVDKLHAVALGIGVEPWQLLIDGLDPKALPEAGAGGIAKDERELLEKYRGAGQRWKISLRYMAGLREESEQEEVAGGVNVLLAKILGDRPYPVERMRGQWTRPDVPVLQEPGPEPIAKRRKR